MINLSLAKYNLETGKFERVLELGAEKGFAYCGNYIFATWLKEEHPFQCDDKHRIIYSSYYLNKFYRDEKDPLNRFDGLFNGRTYGEGRFVLVVDNEDDVSGGVFDVRWFSHQEVKDQRIPESFFKRDVPPITDLFLGNKKFDPIVEGLKCKSEWFDFRTVGNLHENPELYEKVK